MVEEHLPTEGHGGSGSGAVGRTPAASLRLRTH